MQQALRPYATVGVAIVGASLIAVTPAVAPLPGIAAIRDVTLTASPLDDVLTPWLEQYNALAGNATVLANNFYVAPNVALQQFIANQQGFIQEILNDPTKIPDVVNQMQLHLHAVTSAYSMLNIAANDPITSATVLHTLSGSDLSTFNIGHDLLFALLPNLLPAFLPAGTDADAILPIINFIASPMSGMIMGALGPGLSPWVALLNSITDGDGLNATLANMAGAFFNGATLNLDFVLPLLGDVVPPGTISHLDFALGGLLSTGVVGNADYTIYDHSGAIVSEVPAVGGSIFNSVGLSLDAQAFLGVPLVIDVESHGVGPIGAWMGWTQAITGLLGGEAWHWEGKNGAPPPADPPLSGFSFPITPPDFFDDGGPGSSGAAEGLGDLYNELSAAVAALLAG